MTGGKGKKKTVLHEILALDKERETAFLSEVQKAKGKFDNPAGVFDGFVKTLQWKDDERPEEEAEKKRVAETFMESIDPVMEGLRRYVNLSVEKESTNQLATADVVVDDVVICSAAPATFLLGMEKTLGTLQHLLKQVPTLPSDVEWKEDPATGKGIWKSEAVKTNRTEKTQRHKILREASFPPEGHSGQSIPPQIHAWTEDNVVGFYTKIFKSGRLPLWRKTKTLEKIGKLLTAVHQARMRANCVEIKKSGNIGQNFLDFLTDIE